MGDVGETGEAGLPSGPGPVGALPDLVKWHQNFTGKEKRPTLDHYLKLYVGAEGDRGPTGEQGKCFGFFG